MRRSIGIGLLVVVAAMLGCSNSETPTSGAADASAATSDPNVWSESELAASKLEVEQVVTTFFTGLQTANSKLIDFALTRKARESNLIKTDTPRRGTLHITRIEIKPEKRDKLAYAATEMTFADEQGGVLGKDEAIWALRQEPEGWRIAGSIMKVPDLDGQSVALDFEDKEHCEQTMKAMEDEIAKRRAAAAGQDVETAAVPVDPASKPR